MLKIYNTNLENNKLEEIETFQKGSWINLVKPTEEEIQLVCNNTHIETDFIRYALDYEEKARIDEEDGVVLFIIDIPIIEKKDNTEIYTTMPIGMIIVRDEYFITVSLSKNKLIENFEKQKIKNFVTYKKSRFLLQIIYNNSAIFLTYLQQMSKEAEIAESTLQNSMKNKELLKLLSIEKSLVYFTTSLKSNEIVMEKTLRGKIMKLYEEDEDILDDAIVENKQAIEMAKIYTDILNGTMDAYASIISNNLNGVMKFLTSITIILSLPTMIASFWGMNVALPWGNSTSGFIIIIVLSVLVSMIATWWLKRKNLLN